MKHKSTEGKIRWRSIPKYKGLESDVVVITDVSQSTKDWLAANGKSLDNQLYVGMTRAKFQVILLVCDELFNATHMPDGTMVR
jgi:superfamily I DNA/RNA helicase